MNDFDRAGEAGKTLRAFAVFVIAMAFAIGLLWHPSWVPLPEAHGTPRVAAAPELDHSTGEDPRFIGTWRKGEPIFVSTRWVHKRWRVKAAGQHLRRTTGLDIRVQRHCPPIVWNADGSPNHNKTPSCVTMISDRDRYTAPTGKRLGDVQLWSEWGTLTAAHVALDDKDGKRASKAKRDRKLRHYLARAAGLTSAQAKAAVR